MSIQKIPRYQKLEFSTDEAGQAAESALMKFFDDSPGAVLAMVGPQRVVMWAESVGSSKTLYLSPSGLALMQKIAGPRLPTATDIDAADLPDSRALMLGDDRDWDWTGNGRPRLT
jgi:hypothetical protein